MKYKICEQLLNEYTNHPVDVQIGIVDADTLEEANKMAKLQFPDRGPLKIVPVKTIEQLYIVE